MPTSSATPPRPTLSRSLAPRRQSPRLPNRCRPRLSDPPAALAARVASEVVRPEAETRQRTTSRGDQYSDEVLPCDRGPQNLLRTVTIRWRTALASAAGASRRSHAATTGGESSSSLAAKTARIDLDGGEDNGSAPAEVGHWESGRTTPAATTKGETTWVVRAKEADLDRAADVLLRAVEKAKASSHGKPSLPSNDIPSRSSCDSRPVDRPAPKCLPPNHRLQVRFICSSHDEQC